MPEPCDARVANSAPAPSAEVQRLGALVGRWRTEGRVVGDQPVPIAGTRPTVGFLALLPAARAVSGAARC